MSFGFNRFINVRFRIVWTYRKYRASEIIRHRQNTHSISDWSAQFDLTNDAGCAHPYSCPLACWFWSNTWNRLLISWKIISVGWSASSSSTTVAVYVLLVRPEQSVVNTKEFVWTVWLAVLFSLIAWLSYYRHGSYIHSWEGIIQAHATIVWSTIWAPREEPLQPCTYTNDVYRTSEQGCNTT